MWRFLRQKSFPPGSACPGEPLEDILEFNVDDAVASEVGWMI